jgi:hypothetical protein
MLQLYVLSNLNMVLLLIIYGCILICSFFDSFAICIFYNLNNLTWQEKGPLSTRPSRSGNKKMESLLHRLKKSNLSS